MALKRGIADWYIQGEMIEAKTGAWTQMSLLSGSDCIVVEQESVIFPNVTITLRFPSCQHVCLYRKERICQICKYGIMFYTNFKATSVLIEKERRRNLQLYGMEGVKTVAVGDKNCQNPNV